jgi:hypothetical protein
MCGNTDDHDHDHHDHDHSHSHDHCCSIGEDYERNLVEQRKFQLTRRHVLQTVGASGLLIAGGAISAGTAFAATDADPRTQYQPQGGDEFDGFYYISGDHHIHTKYSPDAKYAVQRQVAEANYHGLGWMVITDHGSGNHNKLSVDLTYPDVVKAREAFPGMLVFTGLEMNIPGGEHGTVMIEPNATEKDQIKQFEQAYDGTIATNVEETAVAGLSYLDSLTPKPLFFANHPARRGLDSPHEIRNWKAAAPNVAFGFEGAPGHQAAGLIRDQDGKFVAYRGGYGNKPEAGSFAGYPPESYFTYGGFDWMTAKLGGVWDSLLGDGLRWWITANSDSHKYYNDLQDVDNTAFGTVGYVTEADRYFLRPSYSDFRPGEYSRTYTITKEQSYAAVMAALRGGKIFVVQGDLIDRLKFTVSVGRSGNLREVTIGDTLTVKPGDDVQVTMKVRVPETQNWNNSRPTVDHIDLISGDINYLSRTKGLDNQSNPSTRVTQTFGRRDFKSRQGQGGLILSMDYTFRRVERDFYLRLRGTNTNDRGATPKMDPDLRGQAVAGESPWDDLWFYSNPIFVEVKK